MATNPTGELNAAAKPAKTVLEGDAGAFHLVATIDADNLITVNVSKDGVTRSDNFAATNTKYDSAPVELTGDDRNTALSHADGLGKKVLNAIALAADPTGGHAAPGKRH